VVSAVLPVGRKRDACRVVRRRRVRHRPAAAHCHDTRDMPMPTKPAAPRSSEARSRSRGRRFGEDVRARVRHCLCRIARTLETRARLPRSG
jgi:hypothetical protein